jgi:preprotein translocase subunit YajC
MNSMISLLVAAADAEAAPPAWLQFMPLIAMAFIFWFLILRPQMKRQKEQASKISAIKKGDQVLTSGGLLAKVIKVDDDYAELELGPNVRVKAVKSTLADVLSPAGKSAAND